jgi:hypothetical protein
MTKCESVNCLNSPIPMREPIGIGADPGFNATTTHQQSPNYLALSATPAKQMKSHPR